MWFMLVPLIILLVIVFGVGSLAAAVFGLLGSNWPWLLIAAGIWMFWHEDGRHNRRARRAEARIEARSGRRHAASSDATTKEKNKEPVPISSLRKAELPIDVQVKVEQIRRKVDVLLGYADRFPPFSKDLYLVRQTASEYLPRTINAYLALPADSLEKPVSESAQSPHEELKGQLDLLDKKLDDIAQDLQRQDVDRLLANRQFLEERFGRAASA